MTTDAKARLEYLRGELRAERISYGELAELQGLVDHIDPGDTELLEAAGVPEFGEAQAINEAAGTYDDVDTVLDQWRKPDTITFTTSTERVYVVKNGLWEQTEGDDESLLCIDLWAEGEHVATYTGETEIPLPDADYIVDAAVACAIFVPALADRT